MTRPASELARLFRQLKAPAAARALPKLADRARHEERRQMPEEVQAEIRGRDMVSGLPNTVVLTSEEIHQALEEPLAQIIDAVKETLDRTPPAGSISSLLTS